MKLADAAAFEAELYEVEHELQTPGVYADAARVKELLARQKRLKPFVDLYQSYKKAEKSRAEAQILLRDTNHDDEMHRLAAEEIEAATQQLQQLQEELDRLLLPDDPDRDKNVIVEIRAGVGGEEAALFAADLFRMYCMYAERMGLVVERESAVMTELGGFKEVVFSVEGREAFSSFKFESGVHRVQRVPRTDSQGRIQTSAVSVAVLPEPEAVEIDLNERDIRFESCKSSGAGGQHINKTESAVRLTHLPTGIVVECQEERSQLKNRSKALKLLKAKLYEKKLREQQQNTETARRTQIGGGDRSEKIRTYHFPQNRVTDHRIRLSLYTLDAFLDGDMDQMVKALQKNETEEKIKCRQSPAQG